MMHYIDSNKKEAPAALAARLLEMLEPFSGSPVFFLFPQAHETGKTDIPKNLATLDAGNFGTDYQFLFVASARKNCGGRRVL